MILLELFRLDERHQDIVTLLAPYAKRADIFITFSDIEKVGIHPTSKHDTPIGIYTYPLAEIWNDLVNDTIPFASDRTYVQVLQAAVPVMELSEYTEGQWTRDEEKLRSLVGPWIHPHYVGRIRRNKLDQILKKADTREEYLAAKDAEIEVDEDETWAAFIAACEIDANHYRHATNQAAKLFWATTRLAAMLYSRARGPASKVPVVWNALFRAIGYRAISDRQAQGIIHSNEPCQAVFFAKDAVRHVSTSYNTRKPMDRQGIDRKWEFADFWSFVNDINDEEMDQKTHRRFLGMLRREWFDLFMVGETEHFKIDKATFFKDANNDHFGMTSFAGNVVTWPGGLKALLALHEQMPELFDTYVWNAIYTSIPHGRFGPADMAYVLRPEVQELIASGMDERSPEGFKVNDGAHVDTGLQLVKWAVRKAGGGGTVESVKKLLAPVWEKLKDRVSDAEISKLIDDEWPF